MSEKLKIGRMLETGTPGPEGTAILQQQFNTLASHIEALAREVAATKTALNCYGDIAGKQGNQIEVLGPDVMRLGTKCQENRELIHEASQRLENLASGDIAELRSMVGELGDRVRQLRSDHDDTEEVVCRHVGRFDEHRERIESAERGISRWQTLCGDVGVGIGKRFETLEQRIQALEAAKEADSKLHHEMDEKLHHVDVGTQSDRQELEDRLGAIERLLGVKAANSAGEDTYSPPLSDDMEFPEEPSAGEISAGERIFREEGWRNADVWQEKCEAWKAMAGKLAKLLCEPDWEDIGKDWTPRRKAAVAEYEAMAGEEE